MNQQPPTDGCLSNDTFIALGEDPTASGLAEARAHLETCERCFVLMAEVHGLLHGQDDAPLHALVAQRYELLQEIGRGGMGIVYRARDRRLDRDVALKVLHGGSEARSEDDMLRLVEESKVMAQIRHPNIVTVYDVVLEPERAYVVMEYVHGQTLRMWLSQECPRQDEIFAIFELVGAGLEAAHRMGIVHRDFKPDNILVDDDGRPQITDFGLAQLMEAGHDGGAIGSDPERAYGSRPTGGTLAYIPPEQLRADAPVDARSDVFAFCVCLWEALCGTRPFPEQSIRGRMDAVQAGEVQSPAPGKIPRRVEAVLRQGFAPQLDKRPQSISLVLRQLRKARRRRSLAIGLGIGAALSLVLTWIQLGTEPTPPKTQARCPASSIWGEDIVIEIDRMEAALVELTPGVGSLFAADARAKVEEVAAAITNLAEQTCRDEADHTLLPADARARAYCLRALNVRLQAIVESAATSPDALALLVDLPAPAMCTAWSHELKQGSAAKDVRSAEVQALADEIERSWIMALVSDDEGLAPRLETLVARAQKSGDLWIQARALEIMGTLNHHDPGSIEALDEGAALFARSGDRFRQADLLLKNAIYSINLLMTGDPRSQSYYEQALRIHNELKPPLLKALLEPKLKLMEALMAWMPPMMNLEAGRALLTQARDAAIKADPGSLYAITALGLSAFECEGDYTAALAGWEELSSWFRGQGVFARGKLADAQFEIASLLVNLGRPLDALQAWTKAQTASEALHPGRQPDPDSVLIGAQIDAASDRPQDGLARVEELLTRYPPTHDAYLDLKRLQGHILLSLGRLDDVIEVLEATRSDTSEFLDDVYNVNAISDLAEALRRRGQATRAYALLEPLHRFYAEHCPRLYDTSYAALVLAWIDVDRGALDSAQSRFEHLEDELSNPFKAAWATVGRVVVASRRGEVSTSELRDIEQAQKTLRAFPVSYAYELKIIDSWLHRHQGSLH